MLMASILRHSNIFPSLPARFLKFCIVHTCLFRPLKVIHCLPQIHLESCCKVGEALRTAERLGPNKSGEPRINFWTSNAWAIQFSTPQHKCIANQ